MELCAAFEHVCGVAMAEGVSGDFCVLLTEAAFSGSYFDGSPDAGFGHGVAAIVKGLPEGNAGGFPTTSDTGEEPVFVAMRLPESAQSGEERGGDGDFAGLAAFAVADADDEALSVDVFGFERESFAEAQAGVVDEGEVGAVSSVAKGA